MLVESTEMMYHTRRPWHCRQMKPSRVNNYVGRLICKNLVADMKRNSLPRKFSIVDTSNIQHPTSKSLRDLCSTVRRLWQFRLNYLPLIYIKKSGQSSQSRHKVLYSVWPRRGHEYSTSLKVTLIRLTKTSRGRRRASSDCSTIVKRKKAKRRTKVTDRTMVVGWGTSILINSDLTRCAS